MLPYPIPGPSQEAGQTGVLAIGLELHLLLWATCFSTCNLLFAFILIYLALLNALFQLVSSFWDKVGLTVLSLHGGYPLFTSPWTL